MKKYEKPMLIALSLNGNERLCGDCSADPAREWTDIAMDTFIFVVGLNGNSTYTDGVTKTEFENLFSVKDTGVNDCIVDLTTEQYCKFTSQIHVAWS